MTFFVGNSNLNFHQGYYIICTLSQLNLNYEDLVYQPLKGISTSVAICKCFIFSIFLCENKEIEMEIELYDFELNQFVIQNN
jgi:hypothetical protein